MQAMINPYLAVVGRVEVIHKQQIARVQEWPHREGFHGNPGLLPLPRAVAEEGAKEAGVAVLAQPHLQGEGEPSLSGQCTSTRTHVHVYVHVHKYTYQHNTDIQVRTV